MLGQLLPGVMQTLLVLLLQLLLLALGLLLQPKRTGCCYFTFAEGNELVLCCLPGGRYIHLEAGYLTCC